MLYSDVSLTSPEGLGWDLSLSRHEVATWWERVLRARPATPLLTNVPFGAAAAVSGQVKPVTSAISARNGDVASSSTTPVPPRLQAFANTPIAAPSTPTPRKAVPEIEYVPTPPRGESVEPWGPPWSRIEVTGESYHEKEIAELFAGVANYRTPGGADLDEKAVMAPDPNNPHGEGHAIAVFVRGRHVGYVPHEDSTSYFPAVAALSAEGAAVTVDARVWASNNYRGDGFRGRVTLAVPRPKEFFYPTSLPSGKKVVLLPVGNALQVTGEEKHLDFLLPYVGQNVAVTLHKVTAEKNHKPVDLVEVRLDNEPVGAFTPSTSVKLSGLVDRANRVGGLPVARASVAGNEAKVDVTVYVARSADVSQQWLDTL